LTPGIARATAKISTDRCGKIPLPDVVLRAVNGPRLWLKKRVSRRFELRRNTTTLPIEAV